MGCQHQETDSRMCALRAGYFCEHAGAARRVFSTRMETRRRSHARHGRPCSVSGARRYRSHERCRGVCARKVSRGALDPAHGCCVHGCILPTDIRAAARWRSWGSDRFHRHKGGARPFDRLVKSRDVRAPPAPPRWDPDGGHRATRGALRWWSRAPVQSVATRRAAAAIAR